LEIIGLIEIRNHFKWAILCIVMKKATLLTISIIALVLVGLLIVLTLVFTPPQGAKQYSCNANSDCVSQCANGCVNSEWAGLNPDTTECFRAWDCSCVNKKCYTDGNPRN
jgi:hypothetical protein